jgi:ribosomal-protein-alanine N-acetyltransferase
LPLDLINLEQQPVSSLPGPGERILMHFQLRPFRTDDAASVARYANNRKIWAAVRDHFPHPYTEEDAVTFINLANEPGDAVVRAIVVNGEAVGAIGIHPQDDVHRICVEIGYWLGEPFWGKGIITEAVKEMTKVAIELGYTRVFATVFSNNQASVKVLEKAGYQYEGTMRRAALKDNEVLDVMMYGFIDPE